MWLQSAIDMRSLCRTIPFLVGLSLCIVVLQLSFDITIAHALQPPKRESLSLEHKRFFKPELQISSVNEPLATFRHRMANATALERFSQRHGRDFQVHFDPRSGSPTSIVGHIPFIPGTGKDNHLTHAHLSKAVGRTVTAIDPETVGELTKDFIRDNQDLLNIDVSQLGDVHAENVTENLWQIWATQRIDGISVRNARFAATINHGNLTLIGTEKWGTVRIKTKPKIAAEEARSIGSQYLAGERPEGLDVSQPTLEIVPIDPLQLNGGSYDGPPGHGYNHRLVWTFTYTRATEPARWEIMIDAQTGEVLAFKDTNHYLTEEIKGGVYPLTSTGFCPSFDRCGVMQPDQPMPFADTSLATPFNFANSSGLFDYSYGNTLTTLSGKYLSIHDNCGYINEGGAVGSINLGGSNGQHDCNSSGSSQGNTAAARSCFYEVNKLQEMARGYLPNNTWLKGTLPANVNINATCNAYWTDEAGSINFYKSGGGCRNSGEIAAVFDHEWGHGLDYNDGNGHSSPGESYADIVAILRLQASCIGYGFLSTSGEDQGCGKTADGTGYNSNESQLNWAGHCDLNCSGLRDADWDKHADHTPDTPANFVCTECGIDPFGYNGPCGRQSHCESAVDRQAVWDFAARDLRAAPFNYDANTAFLIATRIFFQSIGNIGNWHSCSCANATSNGCGATNAYMLWLAADDDNGNINDGTPHMTALYNAFSRHGIACNTPAPKNSGCSGGPVDAPVLTVVSSENQNNLSWTSVQGGTNYRVFRTEGYAGCDFGKTLIATVSGGTTYSDTGLANGRQYCYSVMATGSSAACSGHASACICETPLAGPHGKLQGIVTDTVTGNPISNARVTAPGGYSTFTNSSGFYQLSGLPAGSQDITVEIFGYRSQTVAGITISNQAVTSLDIQLVALPTVTVQGIVTDNSGHGWPLYARIDIVAPGYTTTTTYTDPVTGMYSINLYQETHYTFSVNASGYTPATRDVTPTAGGNTENFSITVNAASFNAPGYGFPNTRFFEDFELGYANWRMTGLWHAQDERDSCGARVAPFPSSSHAVYYGLDRGSYGSCNYYTGHSYNNGTLEMLNPVPIGQNTRLVFWSYESTECGSDTSCDYDNRYVDVSVDGGNTWIDNVWRSRGPEGAWYQAIVDLSTYAGSNILVRFRFDTLDKFANIYFGWVVDDIAIKDGPYQPLTGGLVVGNVYAADSGAGFKMAMVRDGRGGFAPTTATPDDPAIDDGFYQLFVPPGSATLTASASAAYAKDVKTLAVAVDTVTRQNFSLARCSYEALPSSASFPATGGSGSLQVTTGSGCFWSVMDMPNWVTITSSGSGTGSGTVTYSVAANAGYVARNGTLILAGQAIAITQAEAPHGTLQGTVTNSVTGTPLSGITVTAPGGYTSTTNSAGFYQFTDIYVGTYNLSASGYGYVSQTVPGVVISNGVITTRNIALNPLPAVTVQGVVTDGSGHGWPLYAQLTVTAPGFSATTFTDPVTGSYSINLFQDTTYTTIINSLGYEPLTRVITTSPGITTEYFMVSVDPLSCIAPGYTGLYTETFENGNGGYTVSSYGYISSTWQYGIPTAGSAGAHTGSKVWGTNLSGDYSCEKGMITSPAIDLSANAGQSSTLSWWQWLKTEEYRDNAVVEVSNDNGITWTSVYGPVNGNVDLTWTRHSVVLDPSYSVGTFRVRFHFYVDCVNYDYGWYVDDVSIQSNGCQVLPGGLVTGNVYNPSGTGRIYAEITGGAGHTTGSVATPADPGLQDGFYQLFLPSGSVLLNVSYPGYGAARTVTVAADTLQRQDFTLAACAFTLLPPNASFPPTGGTGNIQVTTGGGCTWTASSNLPWLTIVSGSSGTGSGTVSYAVAATESTSDRTGALSIAGQSFVITETGGVFGVLQGTITNSLTGQPIGGAIVTLPGGYSTTTNDAGFYQFAKMFVGTYSVTASAFGHPAQTVASVVISNGVTTTQDFVLTPLSSLTVQGMVSDGSGHGWPLYARIDVTAPGYAATVYTNPATGIYSINLSQEGTYTFTASAAGYTPITRNITLPNGGRAENFTLTVDQACTATGYVKNLYGETFEANDGGYSISSFGADPTTWAWGASNRGSHSGAKVWGTNLTGYFNDYEDGYITSPIIDLSANAGQSSILSWWQFVGIYYQSAYLSIEASNDGGNSWSVVYGPTVGLNQPSWQNVSITLPSSYSVSSFRLRINFFSKGSTGEPGWFIDDISIQSAICLPLAGGLVVGNVHAAEGGVGVTNAPVTDGAGHTVTSVATPADQGLADGYFQLYLPPGSRTLAASTPGYGDARAVTVVADAVQALNFSLTACGSSSLQTTTASFPSVGGNGSIQVTTGNGCSIAIVNTLDWLTVTSGSSGTTNGLVTYTIAPNPSHEARTGSITVAGQTYTVSQAGALYLLTVPITPAGGGSVSGSGIICPGSCTASFDATTSVTLTATAVSGYYFTGWTGCDSPSGNSCTVTMNTDKSVTANFTPCSIALSVPWGWGGYWEYLGSSAGTGSVQVTTSSACSWEAKNHVSWLAITSASKGTGNGTVTYSYTANPSHTGRDGIVNISGQQMNVYQYGAPYTLTTSVSPGGSVSGNKISCPSVCSAGYNPNSSVTLTATAASNYYFTGWSGCDSQTGITCNLTMNTDRSVTATFTSCSPSISPVNASFPVEGGARSIQASIGSGCSWTAVSNSPWITILSGGQWPGDGTVTYSVAANPNPAPRTGTITVAGLTFTVTQDEAPHGALQGTITNSANGAPLSGITVTATGGYSTTTNSSGAYQFGTMLAGTYNLTAATYGFAPRTITGIVVNPDATTIQNVVLDPLPVVTVEGTVTDGSGHGWPLYARIDITAAGYATSVYTNPLTGNYRVSLYQDTPYTFTVSTSGYISATRVITPHAAGTSDNFALVVAGTSCTAPGYADGSSGETFENSDGGYTKSGATTWNWGTPTSGPGAAHSGAKLWGTNLAGNYNSNENGYLTSPNIDLSSNTGQPATLSWWQWLRTESAYDLVSVEVSNNGGTTWSIVYGPDSGYPTSLWQQKVVPLDSTYSVGNFRVRFHFKSDASVVYQGWYIDDVMIQTQNGCQPVAGGLVVGNVYDAATGAGIAGSISDGVGHTASASSTPGDPAVDDGFYSLFLPPGSVTLTAASAGYEFGSVTLAVTADAVTRQDFNVTKCSYSLLPVNASYYASGGSGTLQVETGPGCTWVVSNKPGWVVITSGASGMGNGLVQYTVTANSVNSSRTAEMTIGGQPFRLTQAGLAQLTVYVNPSGAGTVSSTGLSCTSGCSKNYDTGANVTLTATAGNGYWFDYWYGCDESSATTCSLAMNSARSVTAHFKSAPVRKSGAVTVYYDSLQSAFDAAAEGDVIQSTITPLTGNITFYRDVQIVFSGGYAEGFTSRQGYTVISGSLEISAGTVTIEYVTIQ